MAAQIGRNYDARDESSNTHVRDFGANLLEPLPPDSILLVRGDLPGNAVRYLQTCEGMRLASHPRAGPALKPWLTTRLSKH